MVEFWEGFVQVLLVLTPTVVGSFASRFIINSWQIKKEKFRLDKEKQELRKDILDDYEKAYTNQISLMNGFVSTVSLEYTESYQLKSEEKRQITFTLKFPQKTEDMPIKKFVNEYKKFRENMNENTKNIWKLFSTVRVYYDLKDIDQIMGEITEHSTYAEALINLLIFSKTKKEFGENHARYVMEMHELRDSGHQLSNILATSTMRSPEAKNKKMSKKIIEILKR